jgi:lauroyl/myristoyl acyltransferase
LAGASKTHQQAGDAGVKTLELRSQLVGGRAHKLADSTIEPVPGIRFFSVLVAVSLLRAALVLAHAVPRSRAEPLCRLAASVWYLLAPGARAAVADNLRHVLGRPPTRREVLAVFRSGVVNYWDTLAISGLGPAEVVHLVSIEGLEHLDAALAAGRGAILVGAHLSSVGLAAQALPARGYPMLGLLEPTRPPEVFEFFARQRRALGARLLPLSAGALRELFVALRRGQIVALVTDRDVTGTGPVIDFFGQPTRFPEGAAVLSVRTGAPILPAYAVRRPDGTFQAWIEPPLPVPAGEPKTAARELTHAVARRLEYHIANQPEQWTVFQRRWP